VREKENNNNKKNGQERGTVHEREKKSFLVALAFVNHSATWNGGKSWKKKKCPLHFTLKRVKVSFFKIL
jgi:hypothetical protein